MSTITTHGKWLRFHLPAVDGRADDFLVVPEAATWSKRIGRRGAQVHVRVDFTDGRPRVVEVRVTGHDLNSVERKAALSVSTDQAVNDILRTHSRTLAKSERLNAEFVGPAVLDDAYVESYTSPDPAVQASVRARRAKQQAVLVAVADAWNETHDYDAVAKVLDQLGMASSYRTAQDKVTKARQAGLVDVDEPEPPTWFTSDLDYPKGGKR